MLLEKRGDGYDGLIALLNWNKETAFIKGSKPIPLRIEQRRRLATQFPKIDDKHLSPNCSVCHKAIEGSLFQCFQCEGDYNMCGSCVTSGKHPGHNIVIRATDSKVNHDAIACQMAVWLKKASNKTRKRKRTSLMDLQNHCKTILLSYNNAELPSKISSISEIPTIVHAETAPSTSSSAILKTEDSDAKSSVCSDGGVLENGTVALSSSSHSAGQEAPISIETSNLDRPPNDNLKLIHSVLSLMINRRFGSREGMRKWLESKLHEYGKKY